MNWAEHTREDQALERENLQRNLLYFPEFAGCELSQSVSDEYFGTKWGAVRRCEGGRSGAPTGRNYNRADWETKVGWETMARDDSATRIDWVERRLDWDFNRITKILLEIMITVNVIRNIFIKGAIQSKKKKKCMEISIPVGGEGVRPRSISIQFLKCVEWSNSSRNAKKIFSIFSGGSTLIWAKLMKIF